MVVKIHYILPCDTTMESSTRFKHVAYYYEIIKSEAEETIHGLISIGAETIPYFILIESDGVPCHN